ncbi:hypothetical protein [Curtobacterium sp. MCPF17_052]|uniref:hypothetical protein n=1 Tax=Curtobacterium sp. MCPF17_052 TaxID=2175655 RepID=UPI003463AAB0
MLDRDRATPVDRLDGPEPGRGEDGVVELALGAGVQVVPHRDADAHVGDDRRGRLFRQRLTEQPPDGPRCRADEGGVVGVLDRVAESDPLAFGGQEDLAGPAAGVPV